jgi:hypothetical protein
MPSALATALAELADVVTVIVMSTTAAPLVPSAALIS